MGHALSRLLLVACSLALIARPASAQRVTFNPSISLSAQFNNDVELIDSESPSDISYRLGLRLPLVRELQRGTVSLIYSPVLERFEDLKEFDQTGHRLSFAVNLEPKPSTSFGFRANYVSTQDQGDVESLDGADLLFNRRVERTRLSFELDYGARISSRWRWRGSVGARDWNFEEVIETVNPDLSPLDDRMAMSGEIALLRDLSVTTAVGFAYGVARFELDRGDEETSHLGSFVVDRRFGPNTTASFSVGAVFREGVRIDEAGVSSDVERTSAQGRFTLQRTYSHFSLRVTASHRPSAGGTRPGTSTNSLFGISLSRQLSRRVATQLYGRYARRDSNDEIAEALDSLAVGTNFDFRVARNLGARVGVAYINRLDAAQNAEGLFLTSGLGLVWYPFEGMRFAGGEG